MIRQFGDQVDGECDVFRRGSHPAAVTLPIVEPYPLAEPVLIHSRADLIDDPGTVAVGDDPWVFHSGQATPSIGVRRIDAGSLASPAPRRGRRWAWAVRRRPGLRPPLPVGRTRLRAWLSPLTLLGSQPTFSNFCNERIRSGRGVSG